MIKTGQWNKGKDRLGNLLDKVLLGTWNVTDDNDPGNLIMRIENLLWRVLQLQEADEALNAL